MSAPTACQWTRRVWAEFDGGLLTRAARDVMLTLRTFRGAGGQCWPSHATLANRAACDVRTVQRALAQGRHLGLVDWIERRVRKGWRWLRTSNRYTFQTPETPIDPELKLRRRVIPATNRHSAGGAERKVNQEALKALVAEAWRHPIDLLAQRRRVIEESLRKLGEARGGLLGAN